MEKLKSLKNVPIKRRVVFGVGFKGQRLFLARSIRTLTVVLFTKISNFWPKVSEWLFGGKSQPCWIFLASDWWRELAEVKNRK